MPQRRPRIHSWLPRFELLEDRSVPAVSAVQDVAGIVTVTLGAAADSATITGTSAGGTAIDVTDTIASSTQSFTGVTGIVVVDGASNAGQIVTFDDSGAGTAINLSGAISVTGIETVNLAPANGALLAGSVSVSSATQILLVSDITTTAAGQNYDGPVILDNALVTLDAGAAGSVTFPQTLNGATAGANGLTINAGGTTSFTGIVGGSAALASLTTDAAGSSKLGANITTTGSQTFNDPAILTGINVTLTSNAGGDVRFNSTLDGSNSGANSIVVNASGLTVFGGAVGTTPLGGLSTNAAGTTQIKANIATIGAQTFNDPVVLFGNAVALGSTVGANITFNGTVNGNLAGETALSIATTTGATTFAGDVGVTVPLGSITTDAGTGSTIFGSNTSAARSVITQGSQTYNDPVRLNDASVTFASTQNGSLSFNNTLNASTSVTAAGIFNTGGLTTFTGIVGGTAVLDSLTTDEAGQTDERTVIRASVNTTNGQTYGDAVSFSPGAGILSQQVASVIGDITFQSTFGGTTAFPVTVKAGRDIFLAGNGMFSASGARLNMQAGATGVGTYHIDPGLTFGADVQVWQAGDGSGGLASAVIDIITNAPSFRDSSGLNAPRTFVLRQDAALTDSAVPALGQYGTALPPNYTLISDDSTLTLNTTTALAGSGTANLTLASAQALSLGTSINAPNGIVRLRSTSASVSQTAGTIAAAGLGVRSGTAITLTGANAVAGPFAALASTSNIQFANGSAYSIGTIGADPLGLAFTSVSGVGAGAGTVTFSQPGTEPLNLTIAASVSGTSVSALGGTGDDRVTVNYSLGGSLPSGLAFNGGGGNDTLAFTDTGAAVAHTYTVGSTFTRDSSVAVTYTDVETVNVTGSTAADTFNITPNATAAITAAGGQPTGATGDALNLSIAGTTNPNLAVSKLADGFQGTATFSDRAAVSFSQMESVTPQADIQVTATVAPARIPVGGTATFSVVMSNAGPSAATGIAFDQTFPAGVSVTWTATASAGSSVLATSGSGDIHTSADLILNGTVTFTITATADAAFLGSITTTATASSGSAAFDPNTLNNSATATLTVEPTALTAVGAGAGGGPRVKVYNADGSTRFDFFAYGASYHGGVTVATGDVNGDGVEDIVTGSATSSSHVKVFDGVSGSLLASFFAFPGFNGGVNVAVAGGDVVVGAGIGGGPVFAGYHIAGGSAAQTFSLFAFDQSFRGGVQVAGSDQFIAVGAGPGGSPHIKVFNASTRTLVSSFYALQTSATRGVNLAMGKSGSVDTVIVGAGTGATPAVVTAEATTGNVVGSALAFDTSFKGGVRVASTTTPSGQAGTVFATGPGGGPRVRVLGANGAAELDFFALDASFTGGIYVG